MLEVCGRCSRLYRRRGEGDDVAKGQLDGA